MRVVDLYMTLDDNIYVKIINDTGETIMWGKPFDIPVGVLDCKVKLIRKSKSITDIDIIIE